MIVIDFNILEYKRFIAPSATEIVKRTVRDYEIDFYITGNREIYINEKKYTVQAGDICFRKPGQEVYSFGNYDCFVLTVDFSMTLSLEKYKRNFARRFQPECLDDAIINIPSLVSTSNISRMKNLFFLLESQFDYSSIASKALVKEILYQINADINHAIYEKNKINTLPIDNVARYIEKNFSQKITLDTLANEAYLDRSYLVRIFKSRYNCTPIKYLIDVRITHAKDLLINTNAPVYKIAEECGYNTVPFFIAEYKNKYGMTPAQHRKKLCDRDDD